MATVDFREQHSSLLMFKSGDGRLFFRSGLNFSYEQTEQDDLNAKNWLQAYGLILGVETQRNIGSNFKWTMGYSFYGNYFQERSETDDFFAGVTTIRRIELALGVEFMLGLQYHISDRVQIYTESYLLGASTRAVDKQEFEFDPGFDDVSVDKGASFRLKAPTSLYVAISF